MPLESIALAALTGITNLVFKVFELSRLAKNREERTKRLAERTNTTLQLLQSLASTPAAKVDDVKACIQNFDLCLRRCVRFLQRKAQMPLYKRLLINTLDDEIDILLLDLGGVSGDVQLALNVDAARRAEFVQEQAAKDRFAREEDRKLMEEQYDALLNNQQHILDKLDVQQAHYADLLEALRKLVKMGGQTKRDKVIAEAYKGLAIVTGGKGIDSEDEVGEVNRLEVEFEERIGAGGYVLFFIQSTNHC